MDLIDRREPASKAVRWSYVALAVVLTLASAFMLSGFAVLSDIIYLGYFQPNPLTIKASDKDDLGMIPFGGSIDIARTYCTDRPLHGVFSRTVTDGHLYPIGDRSGNIPAGCTTFPIRLPLPSDIITTGAEKEFVFNVSFTFMQNRFRTRTVNLPTVYFGVTPK